MKFGASFVIPLFSRIQKRKCWATENNGTSPIKISRMLDTNLIFYGLSLPLSRAIFPASRLSRHGTRRTNFIAWSNAVETLSGRKKIYRSPAHERNEIIIKWQKGLQILFNVQPFDFHQDSRKLKSQIFETAEIHFHFTSQPKYLSKKFFMTTYRFENIYKLVQHKFLIVYEFGLSCVLFLSDVSEKNCNK